MSDRMARLGSRYHEWVRAHPGAAEDFAAGVEDLLADAGVTDIVMLDSRGVILR